MYKKCMSTLIISFSELFHAFIGLHFIFYQIIFKKLKTSESYAASFHYPQKLLCLKIKNSH